MYPIVTRNFSPITVPDRGLTSFQLVSKLPQRRVVPTPPPLTPTRSRCSPRSRRWEIKDQRSKINLNLDSLQDIKAARAAQKGLDVRSYRTPLPRWSTTDFIFDRQLTFYLQAARKGVSVAKARAKGKEDNAELAAGVEVDTVVRMGYSSQRHLIRCTVVLQLQWAYCLTVYRSTK